MRKSILALLIFAALFTFPSTNAFSEEQEPEGAATEEAATDASKDSKSTRPVRQVKKRYFGTEKPERIDAGVFHVAFAVGGNYYIEPKYQVTATAGKEPTGDYFRDLGFQAGVYFDYDYSELTENVPLALRGMIGYKYVLSSVNVFSFDGMVRRMWRTSDSASFGLGFGGSMAVWSRTVTATSPEEEVVLLPSLLIGAGFEFNPFMADFKWLINRMGGDNTIMGFELYFGFRM